MKMKRFASKMSAQEAAAQVRHHSPHLRRATAFEDEDEQTGDKFYLVGHRGIDDDFMTWLLEDGTMGNMTPCGTRPFDAATTTDHKGPNMTPDQKANIEASTAWLEGRIEACELLIKHLLAYVPEEVRDNAHREWSGLQPQSGSNPLEYETRRDLTRYEKIRTILDQGDELSKELYSDNQS